MMIAACYGMVEHNINSAMGKFANDSDHRRYP